MSRIDQSPAGGRKIPMSSADYEAAAKAPIEITGAIRQNLIESSMPFLSFKTKTAENWFDVRATDGYKQSDKSFKVGASGDGKWNYAIYAGIGAVAGVGLYAIFK